MSNWAKLTRDYAANTGQVDSLKDVEEFVKFKDSELAPSFNEFVGQEVSQLGNAVQSGFAQPFEGLGATAEVLGMPNIAETLNKVKQPEGYVSASQKFMEPGAGDAQLGGYGIGYIPRAIVEQGGQLAGSIAARVAGSAVGGIAGSVVPGLGTAAGIAAGAFAGPAVFEAAQIVGPVALERAKNNGREEPNNEDLAYAWTTAGVSGALDAIGAKFLPGGEKMVGSWAKKIATSFIGEGVTETGQAFGQQAGETIFTDKGLELNPKQAFGEGLLGGAAGGASVAVSTPIEMAVKRSAINAENNNAPATAKALREKFARDVAQTQSEPSTSANDILDDLEENNTTDGESGKSGVISQDTTLGAEQTYQPLADGRFTSTTQPPENAINVTEIRVKGEQPYWTFRLPEVTQNATPKPTVADEQARRVAGQQPQPKTAAQIPPPPDPIFTKDTTLEEVSRELESRKSLLQTTDFGEAGNAKLQDSVTKLEVLQGALGTPAVAEAATPSPTILPQDGQVAKSGGSYPPVAGSTPAPATPEEAQLKEIRAALPKPPSAVVTEQAATPVIPAVEPDSAEVEARAINANLAKNYNGGNPDPTLKEGASEFEKKLHAAVWDEKRGLAKGAPIDVRKIIAIKAQTESAQPAPVTEQAATPVIPALAPAVEPAVSTENTIETPPDIAVPQDATLIGPEETGPLEVISQEVVSSSTEANDAIAKLRQMPAEEVESADPESLLADKPASSVLALFKGLGSTVEAQPVEQNESFGDYLERTGTSIYDFDTRPTVYDEANKVYVPQGADPFESIKELATGKRELADIAAPPAQESVPTITKEEAARQQKAKETEDFYADNKKDAAVEPESTNTQAPVETENLEVKFAGAKGVVSKKALPVVEAPTGELDSDGKPITKVAPGFVNDADVLAEVLNTTKGADRVYIPKSELDNINSDNIGVAYEKDTGRAYVTFARHSRYTGAPILASGLTEDGDSLADLYQNDDGRKRNSEAQTKGKKAKNKAKKAGVSVDEVVIPAMQPAYAKEVYGAPESKFEIENPERVKKDIAKINEKAKLLASETVTTEDGQLTTIGAELADRIAGAAVVTYIARHRGLDKGKFKDPTGVISDIKKKVIPYLKKRPGTGAGFSLDQTVAETGTTMGDLVADSNAVDPTAEANETEQADTQASLDSEETPTPENSVQPEVNKETGKQGDMLESAMSEVEAELLEFNAADYNIWKSTEQMIREGKDVKSLTQSRKRVVDFVKTRLREKLQQSVATERWVNTEEATSSLSADSTQARDFDKEALEDTVTRNLDKVIELNGGPKTGGFNVRDMLRNIAADLKTPQLVRVFANYLANSKHDFSGIKFEVNRDSKNNKNWAGLYTAGTKSNEGKIQINAASLHRGGVGTTIVHEALHHIVLYKLRPGYAREGVEVTAFRDLNKILTHIRKQVLAPQKGESLSTAARKQISSDDTFYGLSNVDELFTETLTNTRFAAWLQSQEAIPGLTPKNTGVFRSLYEQVKQVFKNLIGATNVRPDSILSQAMDNIMALADTPQSDAKIREWRDGRASERNLSAEAKAKMVEPEFDGFPNGMVDPDIGDLNLPEGPGWLSSTNDFIPVEESTSVGERGLTIGGHDQAALEWLEKNKPATFKKLYKQSQGDLKSLNGDDISNAMEGHGFLRLTGDSSKLYFTGKPSSKQIGYLKDMGMLLDIEVVHDMGTRSRTIFDPLVLMSASAGVDTQVFAEEVSRADALVRDAFSSQNIELRQEVDTAGHPAWATMDGGTPVIGYDPQWVAVEIAGLNDADAKALVVKMIRHEELHIAALASDLTTPDSEGRVGEEKANAFYDEVMTPQQKRDTAERYLRRFEDQTEERYQQTINDFLEQKYNVVAEFKRMYAERYLTGKTYENLANELANASDNKLIRVLQEVSNYIQAKVRLINARLQVAFDPKLAAELSENLAYMDILSRVPGIAPSTESMRADANSATALYASRAQRRKMIEESAGWKVSGPFGQGMMDMRVHNQIARKDAQIRGAAFRVSETAKKFERLVSKHKPAQQNLQDALGTTDNTLTDAQDKQVKALQRKVRAETDPVLRQVAIANTDAYRLKEIKANNKARDAVRRAALASLPQELADVVTDMRSQIDALSNELVSKGMVSDNLKATIGANLGLYLNRSYEIFDNREWADHISKDTSAESVKIRNDALKIFRAQLEATEAARVRRAAKEAGLPVPSKPDALLTAKSTVTQNDVDILMNDYLRVGDDKSVAMLGGVLPGKKDVSILKVRGQIPTEIRALWGEYKAPEVSYAKTYINLASFIANHSFQQELLDTGLNGAQPFLWKDGVSSGARPAHWVPVFPEGASSSPNPMGGVYGPEIIKEAFTELSKTYKKNIVQEALSTLTGLSMASKTVYNMPQANVRNFLGNGLIIAGNGYLATDLGKLGFFKRLAGAANKVGPNLVGLTPERSVAVTSYVERLIKNGVINDNVKANVVKELTATIFDRNPSKAFGGVISKAKDAAKGVNDRLVGAYSAGDDFWKIVAFESERSTMQKAFPNATEESLDQMAAERVRKVLPTYSQIPKVVNDLFKSHPYFAPFISWTSEIIRTSANTVKVGWADARSSNPALRKSGIIRLASFAAAQAALPAVALVVRNAVGLDDDDEEALRRFLPSWQVDGLLLMTGKLEDGKASFWDLSYLNPYSSIQNPFIVAKQELDNGGGIGSAAWELAKKAVEPWTAEQLLAGAIVSAIRGVDKNGRPVFNEADTTWNKTLARASLVVDSLSPGSFNIGSRIYKAATGQMRGDGKVYELQNEIVGPLIGQRMSEIDSLQNFQQGKVPQYKRMASQAGLLATQAYRFRGTPDLQKIKDNYAQSNNARMEAIKSLRKDYLALKTLGVTEDKIVRALAAAKVEKDDIGQVKSGIFIKSIPSKVTFENAVGLPEFPKRLQALKDAIHDYPTRQSLDD